MGATIEQLYLRHSPSNSIVLSERHDLTAETVRRFHSLHVGKLGSARSVPVGKLSNRCFHPGKLEGERLSTG